MKALVFGVDPETGLEEPPEDADPRLKNLVQTPMQIIDMDEPGILAPDWMVLRTDMCGICGSDAKQVLFDWDNALDNPMAAFVSMPHVLGHEVVGTVEEVGNDVTDIRPGQRVVLNPWLSCGPRGIDPPCPPCERGDYSLCEHFQEGRLSPGIHTGNAKEAIGGFAEYVPAHRQMVIPVPDSIPDEQAVFGDPFAVSLHGITRTPPPEGGRALVFGAGALGTTANAILKTLYPSVEVGVVARFPAQRQLAESFGATVFDHEPRDELVQALADWSGATLRPAMEGLPMAYPGRIDVVYDTVGAPPTLEVGLRVLASRGALVQLGVSSPARFEWTPWYFKELRLVGSNAFGVEEVDGVRKHGIAHYLDLVEAGRVDLTGMLTHTFRLEDWREAFTALVNQGDTGAIKVAFDYR